ncbi:MAG: hypoxanthine phosphoribosyltransferase [Thermodesulfobacteriota bacterium]
MENRLKLIMTENEIKEAVAKTASVIQRDFAGKNPVLIGVLKGSFVFMADLMRSLDMPLETDFMRVSSYGMNDSPYEDARIIKDIEIDIKGRHVLVVEDISDRGITIEKVLSHLKGKNPAMLKLCALLVRDGSEGASKVDYFGKIIGKGFVVGYGLDYKERFRNLPALYVMEETE